MFQYGIVIFAFFGIYSVMADGHGCVTETDKNAVNAAVINMSTTLLPHAADMQKILNMVCTDAGLLEQIDIIEKAVGRCQYLLVGNTTTLATLQLGDFKFLEIFQRFNGIANFCECVPALMQAMAMNADAIKTVLMHSKTGAQYPVINVGAMCASDATGMAIKNAVMMVAENSTKCPNVYMYAEILDKDNIQLMNEFRKSQCAIFDATKFTCAIDNSTSMEFKDCITEANKATGDNQKRCERHMCAMAMPGTCGVGRTWYMWATNMDKSNMMPFQLDPKQCDTSGATFVMASFSLLFVSVFSYFYF